jgi:hypothetical protein
MAFKKKPIWFDLTRVAALTPSTPRTDAALEAQIDAEFWALVRAPDEFERRTHCVAMCALIRQRSPARIAHMERERGLVH